jgi:hypothetical protein
VLGYLLAGLVMVVGLLVLRLRQRKPHAAALIRIIAKAHKFAAPETQHEPCLSIPVLRLGRSDFRNSYIGKMDLTRHGGDIEIDAELGDIRIDTSLLIDGCLRVAAGTSLTVNGELFCSEMIYVAGCLHVAGSIECGLSIHCGDTLSAGSAIFSAGTIGCGRCIQAGGNILARENIRAGIEVTARGAIHAGGTIEAPVVTAGRTDNPRTITCSRLIRSRVNLGELVETGDGRG